MIAKQWKHVLLLGDYDRDLDNMRLCLRLKIEQHPRLREELLATGDALVVEDVSARSTKGSAMFWGAKRVGDGWEGENQLGKLWMELRAEERSKTLKMQDNHDKLLVDH